MSWVTFSKPQKHYDASNMRTQSVMNSRGKSPGTKVAFSWNGLPHYAALLLKRAQQEIGNECLIIGSKPSVPIEGMERILGSSLVWVDASRVITWSELGQPIPNVFFQSGWRYPAFSALGHQVKHAGGQVIGLSDANWRRDLRQLVLGPIAFRALYRRQFDAMLVPGVSGSKLMRYFGMSRDRIRTGMYGADPALFNGGQPLPKRDKTFLFVGQFIARKDVLTLVRAFLRFCAEHHGWTLVLCGSGNQRELIPTDGRIRVEEFLQPEQLVAKYRNSRFFVLPSLSEAWGLVVHEAALCGCALLLSDRIGSADDLTTVTNAVRFTAGNEDSLLQALGTAAKFSDDQLIAAEIQSRSLARGFGPARFADAVREFL